MNEHQTLLDQARANMATQVNDLLARFTPQEVAALLADTLVDLLDAACGRAGTRQYLGDVREMLREENREAQH